MCSFAAFFLNASTSSPISISATESYEYVVIVKDSGINEYVVIVKDSGINCSCWKSRQGADKYVIRWHETQLVTLSAV